MVMVYVSIGSNIDREAHITAALDALNAQFGDLIISSVYESESVGFAGEHFFNLVVGFSTDMSVTVLSQVLRAIEHTNGRRRDVARFSARTLDIDILTWGNSYGVIDGVKLPREEVEHNAFVLLPLAEIAPATTHSGTAKTYAELWRDYDKQKQKLWRVDFYWQDALLGSHF